MTPAPSGSLARGAGSALAAQVLAYFLGFGASILIAQALGATGRGEFQLAVLAVTITLMVGNLGIELSNTVALSRGMATLREISRVSALLALLVGPLAIAAVLATFLATRHSLFDSVQLHDVVLAALTLPMGLHTAWLTNVFVLGGRIGRSQLALTAGAVAQAAGIVVLYASDNLTVTSAVAMYVVSVTLTWLLLVVWARSFAPAVPTRDLSRARRTVGLGLRIHPGSVMYFLMLRSDVFLVNLVLGTHAVGVYSVAVLFAELSWLITNPLVQALVQVQATESVRDAVRVSFKAARFNALLSLLFSILSAATLWWIIPHLYGEEFHRSYAALVLLLPGIVTIALGRPLALILVRAGNLKTYTGVVAGAFALNCALNLVLLNSIGLLGASIASTAAYAILAVVFIGWGMRLGETTLADAVVPTADDLATMRRAAADAARVLRRRPRPA